jgi:hypothetical protein
VPEIAPDMCPGMFCLKSRRTFSGTYPGILLGTTSGPLPQESCLTTFLTAIKINNAKQKQQSICFAKQNIHQRHHKYWFWGISPDTRSPRYETNKMCCAQCLAYNGQGFQSPLTAGQAPTDNGPGSLTADWILTLMWASPTKGSRIQATVTGSPVHCQRSLCPLSASC